jgi:probable F420-dependent oxidoreductase
MAALQLDANLPQLGADVVEAAVAAEERGFDGVWTHETDGDAFLPVPLAAEHTDRIQLGTRIALAFTRSPMVLAYQAWDLARYAEGRFVLGLGTQVKGHNERRFDVGWEAPGPRLREVVEALRHIFDVFQGEADLDYEGEHYSFSLMTETFNPGPIDHPEVPIHIAGINEYNLRLAGELCDGLAMHPFNTPAYAADVIRPTVAEGADRAGRSLADVELPAAPFVVTGRDDEELAAQREAVRRRIAFYGSTRTYHDVLAHHGWAAIGEELHELSTEGRWDAMAELVTDEMLSTFAIEARPPALLDAVQDAYGGIADRVVVPLQHVDPSGGG